MLRHVRAALAHRQSTRPRPRPSALAWLAALLLTVVAVAQPVTARAAAATVTSLSATVTPVTFYTGATVTANLTFCLADGASENDDFTIVLSQYHAQLDGQVGQSKEFSINGEVVAHGTVMDTRPYSIHVVLTDYVESHDNVCGSAEVSSTTDKTALERDKPTTFTYTVQGQGVTASAPVNPQVFGTTGAVKWGGFTNTSDEGRTNQDKAIYWRILSPAGPLTSFVAQDPAPAGQQFDCDSLVYLIGDRVDANISNPVTYTGPKTVACTPAALSVTIPDIAPGKAVRITVNTDLLYPTVDGMTYTNRLNYEYTRPGEQTVRSSTSTSIKASSFSGSAEGDRLTVVKYEADLGYTAGDFDEAPGFTATPGEPVNVAIAVRNTGSTALRALTVTDQTLQGPAMTDLTCDFSAFGGPSAGTTWTGPLPVGGTIPCTGVVPAMSGTTTHGDLVIATATGNGEVRGEDPFHTTVTPPASVSVGDHVWFDENKNGLQDEGEPGLEGVTLEIVGPDGAPVAFAADGSAYTSTTTTDAEGAYAFTHLPVLAEGQTYTVKVTAPEGYTPTTEGADGGAGADDSSTGEAVSQIDLTTNGAHDPTLDFGFIKVTASTPPPSTPPASTPPASTPPASTPPASTPPASTPPASTPPVTTPAPSTPVPSTPAPSTPVPSTPTSPAPTSSTTSTPPAPTASTPSTPTAPSGSGTPTGRPGLPGTGLDDGLPMVGVVAVMVGVALALMRRRR